MSTIADDIQEVLVSEETLKSRVAELGTQITADYRGRSPVLVGVLKGALIFLVDLARAIDLPLEIDFMAVSSYGQSTDSSGVVRIVKDMDSSIEGRDVLIVEDIVDTGLTLRYLREVLETRNPASLRICALLDKKKERKAGVALDYVGFEIPDRFVVGYGFDLADLYRNLSFIGVLKPSRAAAAKRMQAKLRRTGGYQAGY